MILNIYKEICCDLCNEVIHIHFDCPSCKTEYAPTDCYLWPVTILSCEECGAAFERCGREWLFWPSWKLIKESKPEQVSGPDC